MKRHLALIVLLVAACSDDPNPPSPAPASVPGTSSSAPSSAAGNAGTSDIAMGGTTSDGASTKREEGSGSSGAAGGAKMRRDPNAAPASTVGEPAPTQAPAAEGLSLSSDAPSSGGGAGSASGSSGGQAEDARTTELRARARESKWNDFRNLVQKQADLMVKAGLARRKARQDPTPENQDAYNRIWGGIAPLAQKVTEYMAQSRFSEDDRAVMSMIVDEIQAKAMAEVEKAP